MEIENKNAKMAENQTVNQESLLNNGYQKESKAYKESSKDLAKKFIRVGDTYLKEVHVPNKDGTTFKTYVKRDKGTVQDDLGKGSDDYKNIKKYEGFTTVPSHLDYRQEIKGFFNEYSKISHVPSLGDYQNIIDFLSHVFGDKLDFILDYLQLMYCKPTLRLPILLLESKARNTGKSTFGSLLKLIFEDNTAKLGNSELESDFNAIWVKRLAIVIDETSLEKNGIMQMIKRFSTETGKVTVNEKNQAQKQIDFFGKFIFISNEEGKALPIEKYENRFAVFKVPTFAENGIKDNPNIEELFIKEIPHFLFFLINRKLVHQEKSRMYFDIQDYKTEQLELYYKNNLTQTGKAIKEFIIDSFQFFKEVEVLHYSASNVYDQLENRFKYLDRSKIKKSLEDEFDLELQPKGRYDYYNLKNAENLTDSNVFIQQKGNNVFYVFNKSDFLES